MAVMTHTWRCHGEAGFVAVALLPTPNFELFFVFEFLVVGGLMIGRPRWSFSASITYKWDCWEITRSSCCYPKVPDISKRSTGSICCLSGALLCWFVRVFQSCRSMGLQLIWLFHSAGSLIALDSITVLRQCLSRCLIGLVYWLVSCVQVLCFFFSSDSKIWFLIHNIGF